MAFDHRIFVYQKHGGVSRYFAGLADNLPTFGVRPAVVAPFYVTDCLCDLPRRHVWGWHFAPDPRRQRLATIASELLFRPLATAFRADVVHETYYAARRIAPARIPIVLTVYDMIHEQFPQLFPGDTTHRQKAKAIRRADRILCISQSTRRDLLCFFPEVEDRTVVTLLGFDNRFIGGDSSPLRERPYVLFVGMRQDYKNFAGLAEAFARSRLPTMDYDLIAVGGGAFTSEEEGWLRDLGIAGRTVQLDADDAMLGRLYRNANVFAYPSLYEGFGIPPLEAMAAACPVVAMKVSSLPEVCGEAAEWAEPGSLASLIAALEAVALSPARSDELRRLGSEQAARFSWAECARQTSDVYRALA